MNVNELLSLANAHGVHEEPLLGAQRGRPRLLTADEVAELLGRPRHVVYRLSREGRIPTVRIGLRGYGYDPLALERWIAGGGSAQ